MIDAHLHVAPPHLPGSGPLSSVLQLPLKERVNVIKTEMTAADMTTALAMGACQFSESDPLGLKSTFEVMEHLPNLRAIGIMDPSKDLVDRAHFARVDKALADRRIVGLKGYLGYLHYEPAHANYRRYYELAEEHHVPVIFHTGDCYSPKAKLKFALPLGVDEVAVDHPKVRFVIAHVGNPWMIDAAEVIYKNTNVWADLSGLIVGDGAALNDEESSDSLDDIAERTMYAMHYSEKPGHFIYGSDWPLIPMMSYRKFIADMLPDEWKERVFEVNSRALFSRIQ